MRRGSIVALFVCVVSTLCGGTVPITPTPSVVTITMTDTGCTMEGVGAVLPNRLIALVINKTSSVGHFTVQRLLDGHAYQELELWIQERQRQIGTGIDIDKPPPMTEIISYVPFVEAGQTAQLETTLYPGIYGVVCRREPSSAQQSGRAQAIHVVGPFRVL